MFSDINSTISVLGLVWCEASVGKEMSGAWLSGVLAMAHRGGQGQPQGLVSKAWEQEQEVAGPRVLSLEAPWLPRVQFEGYVIPHSCGRLSPRIKEVT